MTIADQINRLNNAKANIKQAIENKGVTVSDSALLDEYPALISSIPMEGGDPYYEEFYNIRTNNGTNMDSMFARTSGELDLRRVDVSNVTSMIYMFDNSKASVNIDGWDTSNVTNMYFMFYQFTGSIDVSKLDTSKVTNVAYMFGNANTDNIILTGFSFPKCTSLDHMFYNATGTTLDLSSWDISNITEMYAMFGSAKYKRIDLTGWNTTNVTNMSNLFSTYNNPLEELIIPDWDMTNCSHNIFYNSSYISSLKLIDLSRSNDATIIKIASFLPTRTATTYGKVLVPYDTSQTAYDALVAKYWVPIGAALSPVPTSCSISAELDEIMPGNNTKVYVGACEPWNADPSKVELVLASDSSIATMTEDNEIISTGVLGDIVVEARIKDTQEVIGTKTIVVSETDSYPNLVKFRVAETPSSSNTLITVNGSSKYLSDLTYDVGSDIYSYDAGAPITSIRFNYSSNISELIKLNISNMTSIAEMFYESIKLTSLDISNWDTSNITNMYSIFGRCTSLKELDLSNFNASNVTEANCMFSSCESLEVLDLSNFNIRHNVSASQMFSACRKLHTLRLDNCNNNTIKQIFNGYEFPTNAIAGVTRTIYCKESEAAGLTPPENWVFSFVEEDTSEIPLYVPYKFDSNREITEVRTMVNDTHTNLSYMFFDCYNLVSVNTEDWDTSNVNRMDYMFFWCKSLTSLDISNFNTSNVTNMSGMFQSCESLTTLDLSNFDTSNVTNMSEMFRGCNKLTSLDISNWDTSSVTNIDYMFYGCKALHTLRLDNCNNNTISKIITTSDFPTNAISGVTRTIYCKEENAAGLTPPTNWVFSFIDGEPEVPGMPLYVPREFSRNTEITEVTTMVNKSHDDLSEMFYGCSNLVSVNTEVWDTSNVTSMNGMFQDCKSLASLDLTNFDTSKVTNMGSMFCYSNKLTLLDLSDWGVGNVTNMNSMFYGCSNLAELDLSNWEISNVTDTGYMFSSCRKLHTLRLDNCSNNTISKLITSSNLSTSAISGVIKTIYCKEENAEGLSAPTNWVFSYVIEEEPDICGNCGLPADECTCVPCEYCGAYDCDGTCTPCEYCGNYGCAGTCQDPCPYCGEVGCDGSCARCENCGINGCDGSCAYCEQCGMYHNPGSSCPETEQ